ncbi:MAG TPA: hypothetical protein VF503_03790 [Sphingobium sp.]|uniref:hypothetical protein n=1 Tax=Sphingobium sp. TaxID=1912891 RepID=UPI002ED66611
MSVFDTGSPTAPKGCTAVDPRLVNRMRSMVTRRNDEALNARFGISYNTWRKLIAGEPVRASLLSRLEERVARIEQENGGEAHPA